MNIERLVLPPEQPPGWTAGRFATWASTIQKWLSGDMIEDPQDLVLPLDDGDPHVRWPNFRRVHLTQGLYAWHAAWAEEPHWWVARIALTEDTEVVAVGPTRRIPILPRVPSGVSTPARRAHHERGPVEIEFFVTAEFVADVDGAVCFPTAAMIRREYARLGLVPQSGDTIVTRVV